MIKFPTLFEINTRILLNELSEKKNSCITLDQISNEFFDNLKENFNILWFVGVWKIGKEGKEISKYHEFWQEAYVNQLPDLKRFFLKKKN